MEFLLGIKFPVKPSDTEPVLWVPQFQLLRVTQAGLTAIRLCRSADTELQTR